MSLLDNASLVLTPNAYKEGKLYSVIQSDGSGDFTFTRATTATRVNSDGLVELVPYNLLQRSEEFDNVAWNKQNATISDNVTTAPDGTFTADKLVADATLAQHSIYQGGPSLDSGAYVVSCYAKAAEYSFFSMGNAGGVNGGAIIFNLTNGTFSGSFSGGIPTIESVGNGWYRCSIAFFSATPSFSWWIIARNANNTSNYTGNGTDGIFIWGAQLVQGTSARDYLRTETRLNIPRLDYSLGGCPNILLEPQRTNLFTYSSSFDNAAWTTDTLTVTANSIASPSGVMDADLITYTGGNFRIFQMVTKAASALAYSTSVYVKQGTLTTFRLSLDTGSISQRADAIFDISLGVVNSTSVFGTFTNQSATITDVGNGWYICTLSATTGTETNIRSTIYGSAAGSIYLWGAQLELGSYSTSYIPTTTASVTRNVDVASKTGASALIGQTEGTMFIEMASLTNSVVSNYFSISDGTYANRASILFSSGTNFIRSFLRVNSISQFDLTASGLNITEMNKIAFAYRQNDFAMYVNGVLIGQSNTGDTFNPNTLSIVSFSEIGSSLGQLNARVNQATLYKERLTNDQLAQLTTL